jgi:hypothetical protein
MEIMVREGRERMRQVNMGRERKARREEEDEEGL